MVELAGKGFLLCLCSKNDEPDVLEVFDRRPDMLLKRSHLVSWRINWQAQVAEYPLAGAGAEPRTGQLHLPR